MKKNLIIPEKPKLGERCNNCGFCCAVQLCHVGREAFGDKQEAPCPALRQLTNKLTGETRLLCHFVVMEKAIGMEPLIQESLGIGKGCDADD